MNVTYILVVLVVLLSGCITPENKPEVTFPVEVIFEFGHETFGDDAIGVEPCFITR